MKLNPKLNPNNIEFCGEVVAINMKLVCIKDCPDGLFIKGKNYTIHNIDNSQDNDNYVHVYIDGEYTWCSFYVHNKNDDSGFDVEALLKTYFISLTGLRKLKLKMIKWSS